MISAGARRVGTVTATRAAASLRPQTVAAAARGEGARTAARPLIVASQKASFFSFFEAKSDGRIVERNDAGPRKRELDVEGFNRDPIHPPKGAGTKAMPFEVPSQHQERVVGFEHPESHAMFWFNMKAGKLHYVKEIGMYFKLVPLA